MRTRRWLLVGICVIAIAMTVGLLTLPEVIRRVAISRIHATTGRPVQIDRVAANLLTGRFAIQGFRLAERDGQRLFADFDHLDVSVNLPALLLGRIDIRDLVLDRSTVRVVRLPTSDYNFSDLVGASGNAGGKGDLTVRHFALTRGTVVLEDQAAPQPRTWTSEQITIEGHDVSTRHANGRVRGSSVTAGTPIAFTLTDMRLRPIHLTAAMTVQGLDLTLAQVYLPPDAVVIDRGRISASVDAAVDAQEGIRGAWHAELADVALTRDGVTIARVPRMTTRVQGFWFNKGEAQIGSLGVDGIVAVRDPLSKQRDRFQQADVRARIANVTWPATTSGYVDALATMDTGGRLQLTGMVNAPPQPSALRLRASRFDLAAWAQLVPMDARVSGVAEADLRINEPLAAGVPARVQGSVAVNRPAVMDARHELVSARRVEASGLQLHWPTRVVVDRLVLTGPSLLVERDRDGRFPLSDLLVRKPADSGARPARGTAAGAPALAVEVGEAVVRHGALSWRDQAASPPARLDVTSVDARVRGLGWPLRGPLQVGASLQPPGGGHVQVSGRVGVDPIATDVRVVARGAELSPYQAYLPTSARVSGAADADVTIVTPDFTERRVTVRGTAGLARIDVRDGERTVMRLERAVAGGLDVAWPERVGIDRLALMQPWLLLERDDAGGLPLKALLGPASPARNGGPGTDADAQDAGAPLVVTVARLQVDNGGLRIVDRAVSPAFAIDLHGANARVNGLSTGGARPARLDLTGRLGTGAELTLAGTIGPLGGPLKLDLNGELQQFEVPRANPYVLRQAGWKSVDGRLTSTIQARIDGDALAAKTNIRISRLQLVKASPQDQAQGHLGLPLGMLTSLMKDKRGDITVAFPVGGRLSDPKFDFSEAISSAVRTVALNAIALPVSWIGRLRVSGDSRIERIDVNPVTFEAGSAEPTPEGHAQLTKLVAFLERLPEARMAMTPVISSRDVGVVAPRRASSANAPPEVSALVREDGGLPSAARKLAESRVDAVRASMKAAGVDVARLDVRKPERRADIESRVAFDVIAPETPPPSRIRDTFERVRDRLTGREGKP